MEDSAQYDEVWIVVVNKNEYLLNKKQADILSEAIAKGRGIVQFKEFIISIPYIKEFFLHQRKLKPEYQLKIPLTEEGNDLTLSSKELEKKEQSRLARWEVFKKKTKELIREKQIKFSGKMNQEEFEERRNYTLKQIKNLP